jgi:GTP-binding protein
MGDNGESSLINLYYKKQLKAKNGEHGKGSQMNGENADDIVVKVPV